MNARLLLPHQLFSQEIDQKLIILWEDPLFFHDHTYQIKFHKQKIALHLASMMSYVDNIDKRSHDVAHLTHKNVPTTKELGTWLINKQITNLYIYDPVDFIATKRIQQMCTKHSITLHVEETPMFILDRLTAKKHLGEPVRMMRDFYKLQRTHLNILVDDEGKPLHGKWSFDEDNRKKLPKDCEPPTPKPPTDNLPQVIRDTIAQEYDDHPGEIDEFFYPYTRDDALGWLDDFLQHRFKFFGPYEDALTTRSDILFHSVLTPMLNIGLLTPMEVVTSTLNYVNDHPEISYPSLEGFIRQIIGWREYVRALYQEQGVTMRNRNALHHNNTLPKSYWDASTGLAPVDHVIKKVLHTGYAHHIERLMILSNIMLLSEIHPHEVYGWFMSLFIDSYDWVMVPNVYGMAQYADGGIMATKPYISGSNYIKKMSDYPLGEWCEKWDALYWNFIGSHEDMLKGNHRMNMIVGTWRKFSDEKKQEYITTAKNFLSTLE